ncbi:MAG TPA: winged helix-turn-helix domain-containing protein [Thermoplasmata archaeon]|nr:winged helix-turn-helix domain-containing protein [Thermoplasmata archaeon]HYB78694.1 winged helix-turn-helix domain-containing protein [Thermoplasmata archaeon]
MMERPDLFVIGRLLEALTPGPLLRTQLQQKAGLNYSVFQRYLDFLVRLNLVVVRPADDGRVELSEKGVEAYRFLSEGLVRIFGLTGHPKVGG